MTYTLKQVQDSLKRLTDPQDYLQQPKEAYDKD